jgi:hypothetical protein
VNLAIVEFGVENGKHIVLSEDLNIGLAEFLEYFLSSPGSICLSDQRDQL